MKLSTARKTDDEGPRSRWVGFELSGQPYALPIEDVREVLNHCQVEPVPGSPATILGVANLRGRIAAVVDVRGRLGMARGEGGECIVVDYHGEPVALRVDRITGLHHIADSRVKPAPRLSKSERDTAVSGVVSREHSLLTLLDVPGLLGRIEGLAPDAVSAAA